MCLVESAACVSSLAQLVSKTRHLSKPLDLRSSTVRCLCYPRAVFLICVISIPHHEPKQGSINSPTCNKSCTVFSVVLHSPFYIQSSICFSFFEEKNLLFFFFLTVIESSAVFAVSCRAKGPLPNPVHSC